MTSPEDGSDEIIELTDIIKKGSAAEAQGSDDDVDVSFEKELEDLFQDSDQPGKESAEPEAPEDSGDLDAAIGEDLEAGPEAAEPAEAVKEPESAPESEASLEDELDALLSGDDDAGEEPAAPEPEPEPESEPEPEPEPEAEAPEPAVAPEPEAEAADSSFEDELEAMLGGEEQEPQAQEAAPEPEAVDLEDKAFEEDLEKQLESSMPSAATDEEIEKELGPEPQEADDFSADLDALLGEDEQKGAQPLTEEEDDEEIDLSGLDEIAAELGEEDEEEAVEEEKAEEDESDEDIDLSGLDDLLEELEAEDKPQAPASSGRVDGDIEAAVEAPAEAEGLEPEIAESESAEPVEELEPAAEISFEEAMAEADEAEILMEAEEVSADLKTGQEPDQFIETADEDLARAFAEAPAEPEAPEDEFLEFKEQPDKAMPEHMDAFTVSGGLDLEVAPDLPPDTDLGLDRSLAAPGMAAPADDLSGIMDRMEAMERRFSRELNKLQFRLDKAGAPEIEETDLQALEKIPGLEERLASLEGKVLTRSDLEALRETIDFEIMARIEKAVPAAAAKVIREEIEALVKDLS